MKSADVKGPLTDSICVRILKRGTGNYSPCYTDTIKINFRGWLMSTEYENDFHPIVLRPLQSPDRCPTNHLGEKQPCGRILHRSAIHGGRRRLDGLHSPKHGLWSRGIKHNSCIQFPPLSGKFDRSLREWLWDTEINTSKKNRERRLLSAFLCFYGAFATVADTPFLYLFSITSLPFHYHITIQQIDMR